MAVRSSMGKGLDLLSAVGESTTAHPAGRSVTELSELAGRDRSQVSRTLAALAAVQYTERTSTGYRTSPTLYAAAQHLSERRLRTAGTSTVEALAAQVHAPCFLGELYGDSTVTIAEAFPPAQEPAASWIGRAYPAFTSDAGQAVLWDADDAEVHAVLSASDFSHGGPQAPRSIDEFLARLTRARHRGYSIVDEAAEPGLISVAAPVWDFRGEVIAGLQVVGLRSELRDRITSLGEACVQAADQLSIALGSPALTAITYSFELPRER